jgi:hypothetical protein
MDALQVPQYQVSKHLFLLRSMGLVSGRKEGDLGSATCPWIENGASGFRFFERLSLATGYLPQTGPACIIQRLGSERKGQMRHQLLPQ